MLPSRFTRGSGFYSIGTTGYIEGQEVRECCSDCVTAKLKHGFTERVAEQGVVIH